MVVQALADMLEGYIADCIEVGLEQPDVTQRDVGVAGAQFSQPTLERAENACARQIALGVDLFEVAVKVLVVLHLVDTNVLSQFVENRLASEVAQGLVVSGRAGFHHTTGHELQCAVVFKFFDGAQARVFAEKRSVGCLPVELGPDGLHIGLERAAVLQFFRFPLMLQPVGNSGIGVEMFDQITGVGFRARLDKRSAGQQIEQFDVVVNRLGADTRVIDPVQRPVRLMV